MCFYIEYLILAILKFIALIYIYKLNHFVEFQI